MQNSVTLEYCCLIFFRDAHCSSIQHVCNSYSHIHIKVDSTIMNMELNESWVRDDSTTFSKAKFKYFG